MMYNLITSSPFSSVGLPEALNISIGLFLGLVIFLGFLLLAGFSYLQLSEFTENLIHRVSSTEVQEVYQNVIIPYKEWLIWGILLSLIDLMIIAAPIPNWLEILEFPFGILVALNISILGIKVFEKLFEDYLLGIVLEDQSKINSELIALAKFLSKSVIILIVIFLFAQSHKINLIGLVASLGVGGVAIAFASQKVLEQILWSVVLYIDRPFSVDDYIHLPDGTLGRVESIGWRSTKVRLSGKNTLVIVPNSNLAQISIENLTGAKRVILIVNFTFFRAMSDEEKALIRQLMLGSTSEILGIDHKLTQVTFQDLNPDTRNHSVQAQVIFFILGTAETSMELRKSLLEIARENMIQRLREYGIGFNFEEKIIDIVQPMNI